ncbi:MAG: hypothetical protein ABL950_00995 [Nitrospira sp.]
MFTRNFPLLGFCTRGKDLKDRMNSRFFWNRTTVDHRHMPEYLAVGVLRGVE